MSSPTVFNSVFFNSAEAVSRRILDLIYRHSLDDMQRDVLMTSLGEAPLFSRDRPDSMPVSVHLPLLIMRAVSATAKDEIGLAVVLTLLETGIYVLDHLMDDELSSSLAIYSKPVVMTAAASLISYLPRIALDELDCSLQQRAALSHLLSSGMARIAHGQLLDVAGTTRMCPTPAQVERGIIGKSGARRALYAKMAASLAGATSSQAVHFEAFGEALGVARQIRSDLVDLFVSAKSRDLAAEIFTLPLAIYFQDEDVDEVEVMVGLLKSYPKDPSSQFLIRERLRDSGALRKTLVRKEMYCIRARKHLQKLLPEVLGARALSNLLSDISLHDVDQ
ncbi:polyprenyl synthetase family protein (plasmid) [Burkholderia sp. M6-3]